MHRSWFATSRGALALTLLAVTACAPAAQPSPTAPPPKPAATAAPAKPAAAPTQPATKPAEAKPAASPAAAAKAAEVKPAETKPATAAKPAATFDERAVADFYRGKTIRLVVGSSPGGGYDAYSRLIAKHVSKHIPGNPNVIVENMPGAGFMIAANHIYNAAAKDGTAIGNIAIGALAQQVLGKEGPQFQAEKFHQLGVPTTDTDLCVATRESGVTSLTEIVGPNAKELVVGGGAPGQTIEDEPRILKDALGANFKVVSGYDGTAKVRLAMDQNEVGGLCGWSWESLQATAPDKVKNGEYVIISQNSVPRAHRDLPNVPVAIELAKTDEARQLIRFGIILLNNVQRLYVTPPEVPADRVQALRQAFTQTFSDPEFLADAQKANLTIDPTTGAQAQELVEELAAMPAPVKEKLKSLSS